MTQKCIILFYAIRNIVNNSFNTISSNNLSYYQVQEHITLNINRNSKITIYH